MDHLPDRAERQYCSYVPVAGVTCDKDHIIAGSNMIDCGQILMAEYESFDHIECGSMHVRPARPVLVTFHICQSRKVLGMLG